MIADRYVLQQLHASGAQSKVWKGLDQFTGTTRVIKAGPDVRKEAILARRLLHPLIAYPYDFGVDPEIGEYAVYPALEGTTAFDWIKNNGDKDHVRKFVAQVAEFLSFLHQNGWLYNDFKPQHFLIHRNRLKVIDLGLCSELKNGSCSATFSGTFPYISPERLSGRPFDQRSDIFAFGILLLQLLLDEDSVPVEPSQGALQTFLYKANSLGEPWRTLVLQMTALEPTQRISSAGELLKKVFPEGWKSFSAAQNGFSLPREVVAERLLCIQSRSERALDAAYNELLIQAWQNATPVYSFGLSNGSSEDCFRKVSRALTGSEIPDFYHGFARLEKRKNDSPVILLFRSPESLSFEQRAILFYGLSCLSECSWAKIIVLSSRVWGSSLSTPWKHYRIPAINGFETDHSIESLDPKNKKILNALAVSGGNLPLRTLEMFGEEENWTELQHLGLISPHSGNVSLSIPADLILLRMRSSQKESVASRILENDQDLSRQSIFSLACYAGKKELAAQTAILIAKESDGQKGLDWYWKAFCSGAKLPRKILFALAVKNLRAGSFKNSLEIFKQIRKRFGDSFALGRLRLDYYHRKHALKPAIRVCSRYVKVAAHKQLPEQKHYFLIRQAGFYVLEHDFENAKNILNQLPVELPPELAGLRHHFVGLLAFFHGNLSDSLAEFKQACKTRHRFRSSSIMNLGVVHGKMGKYEDAERWLQRSIRIFSRTEDKDRLCHAFNNLGLVFQGSGRSEDARRSFIRALQLSRACKNSNVYLATLNSICFLYEREGRIDKAVYMHSRAFRLAKKRNLLKQQSSALTNAGLHLAYMGRFRKAIRLLKKAIHIRSELELKQLQAHACELMGIAYLLARHFHRSIRYLQKSRTLFVASGGDIDPLRVQVFEALCYVESGRHEKSDVLLSQNFSFPSGSFEEGMLFYTQAAYSFRDGTDNGICLKTIHEAERIFRRLPSLFWLGKVHRLKAEFYKRLGNEEKAILSLQSAYHLFSRLGARKELRNLPKEGLDMQEYQQFLERLATRLPFKALQMIKQVLSVQEVDAMVTRVLETALELTSMDRALLILNEEPLRVFRSASLAEDHVKDILDVSRSVLQSATASGKSVLCFDASVDPLLQNRPSIINNRILSVVCLPLRGANGQPIGSLYLDSCEGVETLGETEKILLEIFSSIVGLALSQSLLLEKSSIENQRLRNWLELRKECPEMIGNSPAIEEVFRMAQSVVDHKLPILITGETGTGKELVSRILHYSSKRKNAPFVAVNCAAFSRELLESELFGHEKGSFTGATQQKKGLFEQAQDGTLLLDEIGEMPMEMQPKLLRVLQDGEYRRVGGTQTLTTNARVILATNRNLEEMVHKGTFREDLFYRIKVVEISLPPLRNRAEDIPLLATAFLKQSMTAAGKSFLGFTHEALDVLTRYSWPGNVRQLKSEIERIVALNDHPWIDLEHLDSRILRSVKPKSVAKLDMTGSLSEIEKRLILERLNEHGWNVVNAAKSLGITRHGLYSKMKRFNISNPRH